jgi:hypothetical protein
MTIFWEAATALAPDKVAAHRAAARPLSNADLGDLAERWTKAGLSNVRATRLEFVMQFDSFGEFWLPFVSSATPLSAFAAGLNRDSGGELERLFREKLDGVQQDGSFGFEARALAVAGVVVH